MASRPLVSALSRARTEAADLQRLLRRVAGLEARGALDDALRQVDRAWRTMPKQMAVLAPVLGRLLLQEGSQPNAALHVLARAVELSPGSENEALLIRALLRCGHPQAALQRLAQALKRYACEPDGPLALVAAELAPQWPDQAQAWAMLDQNLRLSVELPPTMAPALVELWAADGTVLARHASRRKRGGGSRASLPIPDPAQTQFLRVTVNGEAVLAGDWILPLVFRLRARSIAQDRRIECEAQLAWCPSLELTLELRDEHGRKRRLKTRKGQVSADADRLGLGSRIEIFAQLPDGRWAEFPDSPLLFKPELQLRLRALQAQARAQVPQPRLARRPPIDVVIPVYQGHEETLACIEAVCRTAEGLAADIVVVDDASPDLALSADLDALAAAGRITLLRNEVNLGFSATVNRAMALHPERDVVLVNADALVFGDWLQRLQAAAYRQARIATVTPFSDDDSVAHYGEGRARSGTPVLAEVLDAYAREAHRGQSTELPVGVGFCMYLRRAAWREVGELDAAVFGKGYGEESDWCMRARKRGWQHRLAADVFVHHAGGASFGDRRGALLRRADRLMELRHPGYHKGVQRFLREDPLHSYRRSFDRYRIESQGRPVVLMIMLALTGGVDRYVGERCKQAQREGKFPLLLRPAKIGSDRCMLWSLEPKLANLQFDVPSELPALRHVLAGLNVERIEFHHFLGLDPRLIRIALGLGQPYDLYLHDYSWICPQITLMDHSGRYCGEPQLSACEQCLVRNGSDLMEEIGVASLRARSRRWMRGARRVYAPSRDLARRMARYVPDVPVSVEPLEAPIAIPAPPAPSGRKRVRVALLGAIGRHKGYRVLLACARDAARRRLDLEFVLIGFSEKDAPLIETGRVFVTGEYQDAEVPSLLGREQPEVMWLPSVWPETWCYTLSHALASGLPTVAFDLGAIAERMRQQGVGALLPLGMKPAKINDYLISLARRGRGAQVPAGA